MRQSNKLFGIIVGVAFTIPYAIADDTAANNGYGINASESVAQILLADNTSSDHDGAVIGGDAPNPEPDRSVGTTADDATITAKVKANLLADTAVGGLKIDVDTRSGVVYLTGHNMNSQAEIDKAVQLAKGTTGVMDVVSDLTVGTDEE
jgi:hyperosmotically inducible protein